MHTAVSDPATIDAAPFKTGYLPALDGLRAIAILLVIPHNTSVLNSTAAGLAYLVSLLSNVGWIGVQLFFALSGFLITGNLLDTRQAGNYYRMFFARRVLRIFPLYYGTLIVMLILVPMLFSMPDSFTKTLQYQPWLWLFLSNWVEPFGHAVEPFPHFWSLAIEEQFYLIWPFVVHRHTSKQVFSVSCAVIIAALAIRIGMIWGGANSGSLYMFTTSRMDALAAGAALAAALRTPGMSRWLIERANSMAMFAVVLLLLGALTTYAYELEGLLTRSYGYSILAIGFALIIAAAAIRPAGIFSSVWKLLSLAPLRRVGRYSYAMYIFHLPLHIYIGTKLLHRFTTQVTNGIALIYMACLIVTTFLLSAASYHLIEKRFLALKSRFVPA